MLDPGSYTGTYKVIGGELCLDFANTVSWRGMAREHDWLHIYSNLARWAQLVGVLTADEAHALIQRANRNRPAASRALAKAAELREAINTIFMDIKDGRPIPQHELRTLNAFVAEALTHLRIGIQGGQALWVWSSEQPALDRPLWPVAWSAAGLLMSDRMEKLSACDACHWLFLDTTRNHSRRWCTMEDCGNRAKIHRFRQKR